MFADLDQSLNVAPATQGPVNALMHQLMPTSTREGAALAAADSPATAFCGELPPNRAGVNVPIGLAAADLTNVNGNKFSRGWLSGAGGADIEQNLGSTAMSVRPYTDNSTTTADFRAAVPSFGAPVAGLANWDVNAPGNTWNPLGEALSEFIPSTYTDKNAGLDVITGNVGPKVYTAANKIAESPLTPWNEYLQMREGGGGFPSYPFGVRPPKANTIQSRLRATAGLR